MRNLDPMGLENWRGESQSSSEQKAEQAMGEEEKLFQHRMEWIGLQVRQNGLKNKSLWQE